MREVLGEPTPQNERELLEELIDQHLIHTQLEQYPRAEPTDAALDEQVLQIKDRKGLPPETIRGAIREHLRVQRFFVERFGQFINATDAEVQKYYDEVFIPAARARGMTSIPPLVEIAQEVRKNILQEKLAAEVKKWLEQTRRTTKIELFN